MNQSHFQLQEAASLQKRVKHMLVRSKGNFPWWILALLGMIALTFGKVLSGGNFSNAFFFIKEGISVTILTTLAAFLIALIIGLLTSLGRISQHVLARNIATFYVELVRGIPILVLIFFIALVGVPALLDGLSQVGSGLNAWGLNRLGATLGKLRNDSIPMNSRAIIALSVTFGAYLSETFRAGIQSVPKGQMEAARSQGMSYAQAMQHIILPQAIRNILPAIGNEFISLLKDSSLVSVLAVRDVTQLARLYSGRTFQFRESYLTLSVLYLSMTLVLSMLVKFIEKRSRRGQP
ncbi:MAG: amino acid ABC transporter permease [Anaerolineaceae bacterium]|nr:amino acid ABC transporter permease [Anaerolineaceae bacterium]